MKISGETITDTIDTDDLLVALSGLPSAYKGACTEELSKRFASSAKPALRVMQGEVGFSDRQLIGTENFFDCIVMILRDPESCKTSLTHFDYGRDFQSLMLILERMPRRELEAILLGAGYAQNDNASRHQRERSLTNIRDIYAFLSDKNVNIVASHMGNEFQPTSVVVDPQSFECHLAIPSIDNFDAWTFGRRYLTKGPHLLHVAFDTTDSDKRFPVLLTRDEVAALSTLQGMDEGSRAEWLERNGDLEHHTSSSAEIRARQIGVLCEEYACEITRIMNWVKSCNPSFNRDVLSGIPVYVGKHAGGYNRKIVADLFEGPSGSSNPLNPVGP